jgi:FlaA1/EpsC-like NDP-sugar epimerase
MGEPIRIEDLARQMIIAAGLIPEKDVKIEWIGLRPGEKLQEDLTTEYDILVETTHPKIKWVQSKRNCQNTEKIKEINYFLLHLSSRQEVEIVKEMKRIVPEFKSRNSAHATLD